MTAFQGLQRGRYIGPVWIGTHEQRMRIMIDANGVQDLTVDQGRRLAEAVLALADDLQALSDWKPYQYEYEFGF
jgi:hypothetical protein